VLLNRLRTENDIRRAISPTVLPRTLYESYDRLLESIDHKYEQLVMKTSFLITMCRGRYRGPKGSLSLEEVVQGIATIGEDGYIDLSSTFLEPQLLLKEYGALLLERTDEYGKVSVEPCHYTVMVSISRFPDNSLL
jgi:hypothetical protein